MPYSIEELRLAGLYKEKDVSVVTGEIKPGKVITDLPDRLVGSLKEVGGGKYNDASRADSSVITTMLSCGLNPMDCYATFANSPRGKDALLRKNGHFDDYLQRTIRSSLGFLGRTLESYKKNGHLIVDFSRKRDLPTEDGVDFAKTSRLSAEKARWVWPGYIPAGKITILAGDPGMGKSTIALDLVSRISRGTQLPSGGRSISGTCAIASAEDAPEDTILPRLIAADANLKRVGVIRQVMIDGDPHYLSLPRDLTRLRTVVVKWGVRILIIDPLNAFLEKGTDTYKDQDVRSVLAPLENMAEETGVSILIIAHLNKKEDSSVLYRVGGSIGFIGAARSVLAVSSTPKGGRVLYSLKSNLARKPPALSYETQSIKKIRQDEKDWKGESKIVSSVIRWKGESSFDPSSGSAVSNDKGIIDAEEFLRQVLVDTEVKSDELFKEARSAGLSRQQVMDGRREFRIKTRKARDGNWYWSWPSS